MQKKAKTRIKRTKSELTVAVLCNKKLDIMSKVNNFKYVMRRRTVRHTTTKSEKNYIDSDRVNSRLILKIGFNIK